MFSITSSRPCELKGTLTFNHFPRLGPNTDVDGKSWDISSITNKVIHATIRSTMNPYYNDTSGQSTGSVVHQTWFPFNFKVIKDDR